jgi:short-subunit dehydrogenase
MARDLRDMIVVITGASAGIGAELARQLSARGARLVLAARRMDRLEALNAELGGSHICVRADVSRAEDCASLIGQAVKRFERIDTLVCNAGYGIYKPVVETTPEETRDLFATNVFGTTDCIFDAIPGMRRQAERDGLRAQIMLISSAAARRGVPYLGVYAATKAAQQSVAEAMRVELRRDRIAVTSVHPIMTGTDFGQVAEQGSEVKLPRASGTTQTVEFVVRRMVDAIRIPVAEVWPHKPTRWLLMLGTMLPKLADRMMARYLKQIEESHQASARS